MALDLITGLGKFLFIVWELAISSWRGKRVYSFDRTMGTVGCEILRALMSLVLVPLFVGGYVYLVDHFSLFSLSASAVSTWVLAVLTFSFVDYWSHRFSHSVPLLWAIHSVHHQVEELNAISGGRVSFLNDVLTLSLLFFLAMLGIPLSVTLGVVGVAAVYSVVLHCPFLGSFGWIGRVVASPAFHRLHHGTQPQYLNKNFSISLSFWDRVFGTWVDEDVPPKYGLVNGFATNSPFRANWQPWVDYFSKTPKKFTAPRLTERSYSQRAYLLSQLVLVLYCASLLQNQKGPALTAGVSALLLGAVLGSLATLDGLLRRSRRVLIVEALRVALLMPLVFFVTRNGNAVGWILGGAVFSLVWLRVAFAPSKNHPSAESRAKAA